MSAERIGSVTQPMVSVILPTFNERGNIVPLVQAIRENLAQHTLEVIVVDDDSPDGTAQVIRDEFAGEMDVRLIVRTRDRGFAKAIREGVEQARGKTLVVMDSDFNHQPEYLPFMVESLRHYECVLGSRFLYGGRMFPRARHLLSWLFNVFVRGVTQGQITDSLYGLYAIRATTLHRCDFDAIFYGRGEYCIRLVHQLQRLGVNILQFPAVNGRRLAGSGNSRFFRTFITYVAATLGLALRGGRALYGNRHSVLPNLRESTPGDSAEPGHSGAYGDVSREPKSGRPRRSA